jgi:hypothetical protein
MSDVRDPDVFRSSISAMVLISVVLVAMAGLGTSFLLDAPLREAIGSSRAANAVGVGILVLVAAIGWAAKPWRRSVQLASGPDGLFVPERTARPLPWSEITKVEIVYDPRLEGRISLDLGWVLVVHGRRLGDWMTPRQRRNLRPDGSFWFSLADLGVNWRGVPVEKAVSAAIAAHAPVTVSGPR